MVVVLTGYNRNSKFDLVANAPGPAIFLQVAIAADSPAIRSFFPDSASFDPINVTSYEYHPPISPS
jgi:hypothetical protein